MCQQQHAQKLEYLRYLCCTVLSKKKGKERRGCMIHVVRTARHVYRKKEKEKEEEEDENVRVENSMRD